METKTFESLTTTTSSLRGGDCLIALHFLIHWNYLVNVCYMEKEIDHWITTKALHKSCLTSFPFFFFFFLQNSSVSNILLWTLKIFSENSWRILVEIYENYKLFLFRRIRKKESKVEQRKEKRFLNKEADRSWNLNSYILLEGVKWCSHIEKLAVLRMFWYDTAFSLLGNYSREV